MNDEKISDMHRADVVARLRKQGMTLSALSRNNGLHSTTLANAFSRNNGLHSAIIRSAFG